jgi:methyltransferase (TIGR00027 family)
MAIYRVIGISLKSMTMDNHVVFRGTLEGVAQTARWTAAARARESRRPDRLFDDPLSELLAGEDGERLLRHFHTSRAADEGNPFLPIRTRWFDDFLAQGWADGIRQVVGIGAGLDTRSFRLSWPEDIQVFEVDQESVLAYKEKILAKAGAESRCGRRTVGAELGDDWGAKLLDAGFDPSVRTAWFGEGVLFYLPEPLARRTLETAAGLSAPGSRIAVDLIGTGIYRFPYMREFMRRLEAAGSPWQSATDTPGDFVAETGWRPLVVTEAGRPDANYGRWPRNASVPDLPDLPRSHLVAAERG